tara:strand:- start:165524 stop:167275 length:1752 start_codon:yes stop_codon:yes gene_type:complete
MIFSTMTHRSPFLKATLLLTTALILNACEPEDSTPFVEDIEAYEIEPLQTRTGFYLMARHAQLENDWQVAGENFVALLEKDGFSDTGLMKRALVLSLGSGNIENAIMVARKLNDSSDPDTALAKVVLVLEAVKREDYVAASNLLKAIPKGGIADVVSPVLSVWISIGRDNTLPKISRTTNGLTLYNQILAADFAKKLDALRDLSTIFLPDAAWTNRIYENVGDIFVRNDLRDKALKMYDKIDIVSMPEDLQAPLQSKIDALKSGEDIAEDTLYEGVASLDEGLGRALMDMSLLFYTESGTDSAQLFAHAALYIYPELQETKTLLAHMAAQNGRVDEAIAYFKSIPTDTDDEYISAQRQVANLLEERGDIDKATKVLSDLAKFAPSAEIYTQLGDTYRRAENYSAALRAYNNAFDLIEEPKQEENWALYYTRGMALERLGKLDEAEKNLQQALEFRPDNPFILNYLGYSWADNNRNLDQALDMIQRAVDLEPNDGYIADSLGWVYFRLGEYEKALPHLEKSAEILAFDPTVNDHLGDLYWQLGRKQEARFQWDRARQNATEPEMIESITQKIENGLEEPETISN